MTSHNLKIDVAPFNDLLSGAKTCEVRNDDRGFEVGDTVHLTCSDGRTSSRTISHIQRGYGLPDGLCVLSYTRAVPDVPELVRYEFSEGVGEYVERDDGEYVRYEQAAEMMEAKDAEIERLRRALCEVHATIEYDRTGKFKSVKNVINAAISGKEPS